MAKNTQAYFECFNYFTYLISKIIKILKIIKIRPILIILIILISLPHCPTPDRLPTPAPPQNAYIAVMSLLLLELFLIPRSPRSSCAMPSTMDAKRRALRVHRAEYTKRKGDLRELFRNKVRLLHQTRRRITKLEKEIVANGEELSEEFDSGSSLGHPTKPRVLR